MIRPIQPTDWPQALGVIRAALGSRHHRWFVPETVDLCRGTTLVYILNGRIVGVLCWMSAPFKIEIPLLVVHPACQRQGIARELVDYVLECRNEPCRRVTADIPLGASWAGVSFFRALGWDYRFDVKALTQHFSIRPAPKSKTRGFLWRAIAKFI